MLYHILSLALFLKFDVQADGGVDDCGDGMGCPGDNHSVTWDEEQDWHDIPTPKPVTAVVSNHASVGVYDAKPRCSPSARGYPDMRCIEFVKKRIEWCESNLKHIMGNRCGEWAFHYTGDCNPTTACGWPLEQQPGRRLSEVSAPAPSMTNDFVCNTVMEIAAGIKLKYNGGEVSSSDVREGLRQLYKTCDDLREGGEGVDWISGTQCLLYSELSFRVDHELIHQVLSVSVDGTPEEKQMACAIAVTEVNEKIRANDIAGVTLKDSVVEVLVESFTSDGEFDLDVAETWAEYHDTARRLITAFATGSVFVIGTICNSFQGMVPKMLEAPFH